MRIRGLDFSYGPTRIFEAFDWECDAMLVAFRGPSGCGKSTLLRLLAGDLTPDAALDFPRTAGRYLVLQEDALFPWLTGTANIRAVLRWERSRVIAHPMFASISDFADRPACRMSYGQRRAVELSRAIMAEPRCLLLDEPFNYLDEKRRIFFAQRLRVLASAGTRVLMTTHYPDEADGVADRTFIFPGSFPLRQLGVR
jgi:ABC-type nitrate/sulfonate/bicarbonate transport system ATPase subunit